VIHPGLGQQCLFDRGREIERVGNQIAQDPEADVGIQQLGEVGIQPMSSLEHLKELDDQLVTEGFD